MSYSISTHVTLRYNQREGRTVVEVLADFPSASPPLEWLLEVVPPLRPRHFSIASSLR
jgi:sulfite reductase alpha subunit-like flavoprotein